MGTAQLCSFQQPEEGLLSNRSKSTLCRKCVTSLTTSPPSFLSLTTYSLYLLLMNSTFSMGHRVKWRHTAKQKIINKEKKHKNVGHKQKDDLSCNKIQAESSFSSYKCRSFWRGYSSLQVTDRDITPGNIFGFAKQSCAKEAREGT